MTVLFFLPGSGELPLFDFSLYDMFRLLGVDGVVDIFKCVLLEHQVLLYSSGKLYMKECFTDFRMYGGVRNNQKSQLFSHVCIMSLIFYLQDVFLGVINLL